MATGKSLNIGLNFVDPNHYSGWNGELNAAEYDANDMGLISASRGFLVDKLIRENATRENVINSITQAAQTLQSGDIFIVTFSGHGGQLPDLNSDEDDSLDETWCLFNGELSDDELFVLWKQFQEGVRILIFSDSCHSGTVSKFSNDLRKDENRDYKSKNMPSEIASSTYYLNKDFYDNILLNVEAVKSEQIMASVKLISGCQDNQESKDGAFNGRFTGMLKAVWNGGKFNGNYYTFHKQILNRFSQFPEQSPNYYMIGKQDTIFDNQKPFTI